MSKQALVLGEILEQEVVEKLSSYDVQCRGAVSIEAVNDPDIDLIILKNYSGELKPIKEKYPTTGIISLGPVADIKDFLYNNGKALLNSKFLSLDLMNEFLGRFIQSETSTLNLEYLFQNKIKHLENIKISGHMSTGYYMDLIAADLFDKNYNVISFREYFVSLISYLSYLKKAGIAGFPFEVEYGEVDGQFIVQCSINISHFVTEYIMESFLPDDVAYPLRGLLLRCYNLADIFDISHIEKKSRLVFTAVWVDHQKHATSSFNSFFLNKVYSFDYKKEKNFELLKAPRAFITDVHENMVKELEKKELPGYFADMFLNREQLPSAQPTFLLKLVRFIQEEHDNNSDGKKLVSFSQKDVVHYLGKYPDREIIDRLKGDDYDFIINCLGSLEHLNLIEKLIDEVSTIVKGGEFDEDVRDKIKLKIQDVLQEDIQRVKGRLDVDGSKIVVSGEQFDLTDEQWKLKSSQFSDESMSILHSLETEWLTVENFTNALEDLVQDKFDLSTEESSEFLEKIFHGSIDNVVNDEVMKRMQEELGVEGDTQFLSLLKKIEQKDHQMENMQENMSALLQELNTLKDLSLGSDDEYKSKFFQLTKIDSMKEKLISNLKRQKEVIREEADRKIVELNTKNSTLLKNIQDLKVTVLQDGSETKDSEIANFRSQLDEKNKIIEKMHSKNISSQQDAEDRNRRDDINKVVSSLSKQKDILVVRVKKVEDELSSSRSESKRSSLQIKQLVEKLSFTRQQINMQDKQLNSYKKGAKGGGSGSDAKVRHLESRIEKLNELAEKNTESVSNARRDALQFKNEKTLLQNQINELKRKLTVAK